MMREELQNLSVDELIELVLNLQATNKQLQAGNDLLAATLNSQVGGNSTDLVPAADIISLVNNYHDMTSALRQQQEALEDQLRRTALLMQISIELRETLDPATIVERVLRVMFSTLHVVNASIVLASANAVPELAMSLRDGEVQRMPQELAKNVLEQGLAGWVIRHGRSVVLPDVSRDKRWVPYMDWQQSGSVIVLPIRQSKILLGALTVYDPTPNFFTGRDLLLMEGVVSQAGVALGAARSFREEIQRREQALTLLAMSQFLTVERSYDDLASMLQEKSSLIFGMQYGLLYLAQNEETLAPVLVPPGLATPAPGDTPNDPHANHAGILDFIASVARRAWQQQAMIQEVSPPDAPPLTGIALPLVQGGNATGAFVLVRTARTDVLFTANTWSLLTIFTNVIAAACSNMHLVARLREHTELLEQQVEERTHQLQRSRDLLRIVFDHLPEGLLLLDAEEVVLAANHALCQGIIGQHPRSVVGRGYSTIWEQLEHLRDLHVEHMPPSSSGSGSADPAALVTSMRLHFTDATNQRHWYEVQRTPLPGTLARDAQFLERWHDLTHQQALLHHLLMHEQLTSMGRVATSMFHEVGNPLQSTITSLELCREDATLSAKTHEYLRLAHQELKRLARMLENLRHFYHPPHTTWEHVDINRLLHQLQQLIAPQFEQQHITLQLDLEEGLPRIHGQPDALRQVFFNLVLNAQYAMPQGGTIVITSRWNAAEQRIHITIADTGRGMSSEQLQQVFNPFQSDREDGMGLGLYLSKQIIEQHGGHIALHSIVEQGTEVDIALPQGEQTDGDSNDTAR